MLNKFKEHLILNGYSNMSYYYRIKELLQEIKLKNISKETINKFILKKKETKATETVNAYIKALKIFFKFNKIDIELPKLFKVTQKIPDSISLEYLEKQIIPCADLFNNPLKIKAILLFMFWTGIRKSEILTLTRNNINLGNRTAKIIVKKTKKEKFIMFTKDVADVLRSYFDIEKEQLNAFNLKENTIKNIFLKLKPNFPDINLRPHLLRHSCATYFMGQGANMKFLQNLLGHKSIRSTERYLDTNLSLMKSMYDNLSKKKVK